MRNEKARKGRKKIGNFQKLFQVFCVSREKISSAIFQSWGLGINCHLITE